jgi:glycosyltransferase involved in cell wall biosynthesis
MYCGNCFRDNALVAALRRLGHQTLMVPLYLPMTVDEDDQSAATPIFFSGIGVYLEQKSAFFRKAPRWFHQLLRSRRMLGWVAGRAASTRASEVADIALSMLQGEDGRQARELNELVNWLKTQPRTDVVALSNAMLSGLARRIQSELRVPVVCMFQGEAAYLDSLPLTHRDAVWAELAARARDVDLFIAPSRHFADLMAARLGLDAARIRVVWNGISLEGYPAQPKELAGSRPGDLTLGFFARMCPDKGMDRVVDAFLEIRRRGTLPRLKLALGGSCGPSDQPFLEAQLAKVEAAGLRQDTRVATNLSREDKIAFLRSADVLSVPALYGEAFGLYVIESLAAGTPVVQPRAAAFPELMEATGGGLLFDPAAPGSLAQGVEELLLDPVRRQALGEAGHRAVRERFAVEHMARAFVDACQSIPPGR